MKQIYPASITGKGFAQGGSVLDHKFGDSDPFTLGVEEEYMLLDGETFDLVQHIDTVLADDFAGVRGQRLADAFEIKNYEFNAHGVELERGRVVGIVGVSIGLEQL